MNHFRSALRTVQRSFLLSLGIISCGSIFSFGQNNNFQWVKQIGSTLQDFGSGVATDSKGNVYASGHFQNTAFIGPVSNGDSLVSNGNYDIFLTKTDKDGQLIWAHAMGGSSTDESHAVTVDKDDNVIITGSYRNAVDFDNGPGQAIHNSNNGSVDVFIAKYDSSGNYIWAKTFGSRQLDRGYSVATDAWNNVYVTGQFVDTVTIPDINVDLIATNAPGSIFSATNVFVCKLNEAGNFVWAKNIGSTGSDVGHTIRTDRDGNPIIVGRFTDSVDFDPGSGNFMMHSGNGAQFITKWDSAANFIWAKQLKGSDNLGYLLATDANNHIFLTGIFNGKVDFNVSPLPQDTFYLTSDLNVNGTNYSDDGFLLKLDENGAFNWVKQMAGSGIASGRGVTVDVLGNAYVVGQFTGIVKFDSTAVNNQFTALGSGGDVYISKYSSTGDNIWNTKYGGISAEFSRAITTDYRANVYTVGHFVTTGSNISNFHNGTDTVGLSVYGGYDVYMHKIGCDNAYDGILQQTACGSFTIDTLTFDQSGVYNLTFWNAQGCDSIVTLDLTINNIEEPFITVNNLELGVTGGTYNTYQWLQNGTVIPGATNATYNVTSNADYQVVVSTDQGCTDTSEVYTVTSVSVKELNKLAAQIKVYPNPSDDIVNVNSPVKVTLQLTTIDGRIIFTKDQTNNFSIKELANGVYFLKVMDTDNRLIKVEKIVKQ